jgi:hypothetical protein
MLLAAGTNDMNSATGPNGIAKEGNNPVEAAERLGALIDKILAAVPEAVVLVARIINVGACGAADQAQHDRTITFNSLIPSIVEQRKANGAKIQTVEFGDFLQSSLRPDCVHPTNDGYRQMGDWWYDYISQIPGSQFIDPIGPDPNDQEPDPSANGGIDQNVPPPNWGPDPIQPSSPAAVAGAAAEAGNGGSRMCNANPWFRGTGMIAHGLGSSGSWQWTKQWAPAQGLKVADGIGRDPKYVRLADMNGDGKADYVWVHPDTGEVRCWINNLPDPWTPATPGMDLIAVGSPDWRGNQIFLADMNGDKKDDYLIVDGDTGSVFVYWNGGFDPSWENSWRFVPGGQIASGVPHANLATIRFPDINGDGRADYVYVGQGGSLGHWLNTGKLKLRHHEGVFAEISTDGSRLRGRARCAVYCARRHRYGGRFGYQERCVRRRKHISLVAPAKDFTHNDIRSTVMVETIISSGTIMLVFLDS